MKINNDKYYTPVELANNCYDKVISLIGLENITDVVEPSCGNGSFFQHDRIKPSIGIDIKPEITSDNIIEADWLTYDLKYRKGRLVIGNPPYGSKMYLAQKFFKKAITVGDYVAFILPIGQYNNTQSLFEFDLIYSEDLGVRDYSGRELHCCFNIYKRPESGVFNKRPSNKLKVLSICRNDSKKYPDFDYDIRMCAWGDGTAGKILSDDEHYSAEYKIKVSEDCEDREEILNFLKTFDWRGHMKCIAMRKIQQFHIINILKDYFKDIE